MSKYDSHSDQYDIKPKRRGRFFLWLLAGLLLLAALAPNIVGWTGQTNSLVERFVKVDGQLHAGSASLGWFQNITLKNVSLKDASGNLVLKVDQVQSSKSLLSLAMNSSKFGEFTIDGADLSLVMMRDSSNLEQVLKPLLESDAEKNASAIPEVAIQLNNSRISIRKDNETDWTDFEQTNASISVQPQQNKLLVSLNTKPKDAGTLEANGQIDIDFANQSEILSATGELVTQSYNVASLEPVLYRVDPAISLNGHIHSRLKANWKNSGEVALEVEQLRSDHLEVTAAEFLGPKPLVIQGMIASGDLHLHGSIIDAQQFALKSNFAVLDVEGTFDASELVDAFSGQGSINHDFKVSGQVDLAALSKAAPGLVSVRDDIEIQQALVTCNASSRIESGQRRLFASLELPSVAAKRFAVSGVGGARRVHTDRFDMIGISTPVRLSAATRQADASAPMWLEFVKCESEFLSAEGGTQANGIGTLVAAGNLKKLKQQLDQFLDLSGIDLDGRLDLNCRWGKMAIDQDGQPLPNPPFRVGGSCSFTDFVYSPLNMPAIREQQLDVKFGGDYDYQTAQSNTLKSGGISVQSGKDFASLSLAKPIENPGTDSAFLANFHIEGKLPDWVRRANAFTWIPAMDLKGNVNADGQMLYTPKQVSFQTTRLLATDFFLGYSALKVGEPQLQGAVEGIYDFESEKFTSNAARLVGGNIDLLASDTVIDMAERPTGDFLTSSIDLNASMERLMFAIGAASAPCPYRGTATGKIKLTMRDWDVKAVVNGTVNQFQYLSITPATQNGQQAVVTPMWSEKQIGLFANGTYNLTNDFVHFESAQMLSDGVRMDMAGRINDLSNSCQFNLDGTLRTDTGRLGDRVRETFGLDLRLKGNDESKFLVRGPLYTAVDHSAGSGQAHTQTISARTGPDQRDAFYVQAMTGWDEGIIYGLPFGSSKVSTRVTTQRADFAPIQLQLTNGRLSVHPTILFGTEETLLTIRQEKIIDHANISPEICSEWLKFVAPMLAEATAARGEFSVDLKQNAVMPLSNPLMGTLDCDVILHNAEVGPGPLGREIIQLVGQVSAIIKGKSIGDALVTGMNLLPRTGQPNTQPNVQTQSWLRMPEQTVGCRVVNGRVYHRDLIFQVKDIAVSTTGSVGADQSIDIVATIPIRKEWVDSNKYAGLIGDSIQVPIRGSLTKPTVGREILSELPKMLMQKAAGNYVEEKAGQFLKDSAGKLIGDKAGDLFKGIQLPVDPNQPKPGTNPLQDAAGNLLEDQLRQGLKGLFERKTP